MLKKNLIKELHETGIIDHIGDAISVQDTDFRILYQNIKSREFFGSHVGQFCYKAISNRDSVCDSCSLDLSLKDGKARTVERCNPSTKDLFVEVTTSAIRDSRGKIIAGIEVVRDISHRKREEDREKLVVKLQDALDNIKTLRGLLPICSSCNKIRDNKSKWTSVDVYIRDHSEAELTHGYCPQCAEKHFSTDDKRIY